MIVKELGLQGAKTLRTPVSATNHQSEELLTMKDSRKYQCLCARVNFLAIDPIDLQFGTEECCRSMSRPTVRDWSKLQRMGRILRRLSEAGVLSSRTCKRCLQPTSVQTGPEMRETDGAPAVKFSCTEPSDQEVD